MRYEYHVRTRLAVCLGIAFLMLTGMSPAHAQEEEILGNPEYKWQFFFTAANVYPKLNESEDKIDTLIKDGLGLLFLDWTDPVTFKDLGRRGLLWDFQIGVSRALSDQWSVFVSGGGAAADLPNSTGHIPLNVDVDFHRSVWFVTAGADYYFMGRPVYTPPDAGGNWFSRSFRGARPYAEVAVGYVNQVSEARVGLSIPIVDIELLHHTDRQQYDLMYLSPRLGVEIPLARRHSMSMMVGYLFFMQHAQEFNNLSIYSTYRYQF